jgi:hypothetical protein
MHVNMQVYIHMNNHISDKFLKELHIKIFRVGWDAR